MSLSSINTALIPYTLAQAPMEFIRSEVERGLKNGTIDPEEFLPKLSAPQILGLSSDILERSLASRRIDKKVDFQNFKFPLQASSPVSTYKNLNGDEIAEALQAEAAFTVATDKKPIVATYGAGSCIALGGYEATNKIAFVVHFSGAGEVRESGGLIFYNISELAKKKIEKPIQLHLRGGFRGQSEAIVNAIKVWMMQRTDLPMEIASEDILDSGMSFKGKSLSVDSRTGEVAEYDPKANLTHRDISELDVLYAMMSAFAPRIRLAYSPKVS